MPPAAAKSRSAVISTSQQGIRQPDFAVEEKWRVFTRRAVVGLEILITITYQQSGRVGACGRLFEPIHICEGFSVKRP